MDISISIRVWLLFVAAQLSNQSEGHEVRGQGAKAAKCFLSPNDQLVALQAAVVEGSLKEYTSESEQGL